MSTTLYAAPHEPDRPSEAVERGDEAPSPAAPALESSTLLQGGRAVTIRHNGELYRLQATRQGKLILTK